MPYDFTASKSMRLLAVDLDKAGPDILAAFKYWLKQQPNRPFPRPGHPGLQGKYTPKKGKLWHHYRILAILDLALWCTMFGWRMPSDEKLGDWLKSDYAGQTKNWGRQALMATQQAVDDLRALPSTP